jgi:hypothetical protein
MALTLVFVYTVIATNTLEIKEELQNRLYFVTFELSIHENQTIDQIKKMNKIRKHRCSSSTIYIYIERERGPGFDSWPYQIF